MLMKSKNPTPQLTSVLAAVFLISAGRPSHAVPYASTISEAGGNVTFYLNETADNVKVVFSVGP